MDVAPNCIAGTIRDSWRVAIEVAAIANVERLPPAGDDKWSRMTELVKQHSPLAVACVYVSKQSIK